MRASKQEYDEIAAIGEKFCEALYKADSKIVEPYFAEGAYEYGNWNGTEVVQPISGLLKSIDTDITPEIAANLQTRVDVVAIEETIAWVVILEENFGGVDFTNYLPMKKFNDGWKFLSHIYNQSSATL